MILCMIGLNSLAAFTQDVSRSAGIGGVQPVRAAPSSAERVAPAPGRALPETLPEMPARPLPRGSLLDLRV